MPTLPLESIMKAVPEALRKVWPLRRFEVVATTKIGRVDEAEDEVAWMETRPHGEEVPKPV